MQVSMIQSKIHSNYTQQKLPFHGINSCIKAEKYFDLPVLSNIDIPVSMYFIRMTRYGRNINWAINMNRATKKISSMIKDKADISSVIKETESAVHDIYLNKRTVKTPYGIRKQRSCGCFDLLSTLNSRGNEYYIKYKNYLFSKCHDDIYVPRSNEQYKDAITCKIMRHPYSITILQGRNNASGIQSNLSLVEKAYKKLINNPNPSKKEVVDTAATIQWLIAQETPYLRGSDSVANLLTRSLMHSYGIKLSPLKAGVSCDFEAFYKNLDDYIAIYPSLFEKNPLLV